MEACYAQQNSFSFTASGSESASVRNAAFSFILFVMGIVLAMSVLFISVSLIIRIILPVLLIAAVVIINKPSIPRG